MQVCWFAGRFVFVLFVFLEGPVLDPPVVAQSKRSFSMFEVGSNKVCVSRELLEHFWHKWLPNSIKSKLKLNLEPMTPDSRFNEFWLSLCNLCEIDRIMRMELLEIMV